MILLQLERESRGWSRQQLAFEARVSPSYIGMAERRLRKPYRPEIERIAAALDFMDDPQHLLEDVSADACD